MSPRPARWVGGLLAGAVAVAAIAAGSAAPLPLHTGDAARVRVSWSARPERIETCRRLSEEEIAALPEHMRREVECEGGFATYALEVSVDGRRLEQAVITGGGLRRDRPIHYLRDFDVAGGEHSLHLSLTRREAGSTPSANDADHDEDDDDDGDEERRDLQVGRSERERAERRRREETALPASLVLDTTLVLEPGDVAILTFDPASRAFVVSQQ